MAKIISQETYDDVVKENIVEFEMEPTEAREETIKQFEAQGISLVNIIKDLSINPTTGLPVLNEAVELLKTFIGSDDLTKRAEMLEMLTVLETECQKSIPHRVLAAKYGAHDVLISLLEQELNEDSRPTSSDNSNKPDMVVLEKCLRAINSLTNNQPDIFNAAAVGVVVKLLQLKYDETIICQTLQWLQKTCIMHEINRQTIINAGLIKHLKPLLTKDSAPIMRDVTAVLRFLVLDDDIRVEFGSAHEHARLIASESMNDLCQLLAEYEDITVLSDLILTIGTLAVRQEFCTTIEDAGGLKFVLDIMSANPNAVRLNREALKLLRALAGNDAVKAHIIQQGACPIIKELLHTHMANETIVTPALACISTLTLRVKENSVAFFETGIAETIVESMRLHPTNKTTQRNGAWAIRNMVARARDQCDIWLSFGIEDLLNTAMTEHPSVKQDIKAALRDLGCKVELREEWTGTAEKKITNDYNDYSSPKGNKEESK